MGICFVGLAKSCKFAENLQNEIYHATDFRGS